VKLEREAVRVDASTTLELLRLTGSRPGPVVAVLGGVHGDEPEGVVAVRRLAAALEGDDVSGTVVLLPASSPRAVEAGTRVSPVDGGDLARSFPGAPGGSHTEQVAHAIDSHVIEGADFLVDLHSAGRDYHMPLFVGAIDDGSPQGSASVAAAVAFGAPILWLHGTMNPGRSLSAAWARAIPAVYAESGGGGALRHGDLDAYVGGMLSLLAHLGMRAPAPVRASPPERVIRGGDGNVDLGLSVPADGFVIPLLDAGATVTAGDPLVDLLGTDGASSGALRAAGDGTVMMIRHRATVRAGETVAMIAPLSLPFDRSEVLGR